MYECKRTSLFSSSPTNWTDPFGLDHKNPYGMTDAQYARLQEQWAVQKRLVESFKDQPGFWGELPSSIGQQTHNLVQRKAGGWSQAAFDTGNTVLLVIGLGELNAGLQAFTIAGGGLTISGGGAAAVSLSSSALSTAELAAAAQMIRGASLAGSGALMMSGRPEGANSADDNSKVGQECLQGEIQTTAHGAERVAGTGATRGGVLSEAEIAATRAGTKLTQADGAIVRVLEGSPGKFNVVVEGDRGIITTFKNLSQKSLDKLAKNYGWK